MPESKQITIKKKDGTKLSAVLDAPETLKYPLVIICHGFAGSKEDYQCFVPEFLKNSIALLRFDFSGHGESEGKFEDTTLTNEIEDLLAVYDYAMKLPRVSTVGLFGHSMGADVAMLFSIAKKVHAVVASAPPFNFKDVHKTFSVSLKQWQEEGHVKPDWLKKKIKYTFYEDLQKYDMKPLLPFVTTPTLVMGGDKDEMIPVGDFKEVYNLLKGAKSLKIFNNTTHDIYLTCSEDWIATSIFWFLKWLK